MSDVLLLAYVVATAIALVVSRAMVAHVRESTRFDAVRDLIASACVLTIIAALLAMSLAIGETYSYRWERPEWCPKGYDASQCVEVTQR